MTNNEELEKIVSELESIYDKCRYPDTDLDAIPNHGCFVKLAAWHILEKHIAVLENELKTLIWADEIEPFTRGFEERIIEIKNQLTAIKKEIEK